MTEETKKDEIEKLRKRNKNAELVGLCIMLGGALALLVALLLGFGYSELISMDHITDQDMPVRDIENATYTYTAEELESQYGTFAPLLFLGGTGFIAGYIVLVTAPSERSFHKLHCDGTGEAKYCSECGIKLSRLEKR